jgi:hypothetical protein
MFLKRKPRLVVTWTSNVLQIATFQTYKKQFQKGFEFFASHNNLIDGILCHIAHLHITLLNTNEYQWYQKTSSQNKM